MDYSGSVVREPVLLRAVIVPLSRLTSGGGLLLIQVSERLPVKGENRD